MIRWSLAALSFLVALLAVAPHALASQVAFRPLSQVVAPDTRVFTAVVTRVERAQSPTQQRWDYALRDARALRGAAPIAKTARYTEVVPVMLGPDGGVIGHFSPVLDASGEEGAVRAGATYVFFARSAPEGPGEISVFRVEPMSRLAAVREVLAALPEAGAATAVRPATPDAPSATTTTSAATASSTPAAPAATASSTPAAPAASATAAPSATTAPKPAARRVRDGRRGTRR